MPRRASGGELRGADVHAAVELHRVGVDDLGRAAAGRELLGEVEGEFGLAGSRCADEGDEHRSARPERRQADVDRASAGRRRGRARRRTPPRRDPRRRPRGCGESASSSPAGRGDEEVRGGASDDDAHDVAGARDGAALRHVEVNQSAVFGATREPVVLLVSATLAAGDEHLDASGRPAPGSLRRRCAPAARPVARSAPERPASAADRAASRPGCRGGSSTGRCRRRRIAPARRRAGCPGSPLRSPPGIRR